MTWLLWVFSFVVLVFAVVLTFAISSEKLNSIIKSKTKGLPLKRLGFFSKAEFSWEGIKPCFFVAFNILIRHFVSINYFHQFFWISWHFLVATKLMMSAFFDLQPTSNRLFKSFYKVNWYWITLLEIWREGRGQLDPPRKNYLQKARLYQL